MRSFHSVLAVALVTAGALAPPLAAQETRMVQVARYSEPVARGIINALASRPPDLRGLNRMMAYFRVPAVPDTTILCEMSLNGL